MTMTLTDRQIDHYRTTGWLLASPLDDQSVRQLRAAVDEVQQWDDSGDWMHHREMTDDGPKLCRTENFVPFHPWLRSFLCEGVLPQLISALVGEPVLLYKEKINYKLNGGAGFRPHQDAPAYPFITGSVSVMVAVDESTADNGCLEVVSSRHQEVLPMDDRGCIIDAWVQKHDWREVPMAPGDILIFDALTPHRSGTNNSGRDRRAIFPTYNRITEGNLRTAYYEEKLRRFNSEKHSLDTVRISLINDFEGRSVK